MTVSQLISQLQRIQAANDYDDMEVVADSDFINWYSSIDSVDITECGADNYDPLESAPNTRNVVCISLS